MDKSKSFKIRKKITADPSKTLRAWDKKENILSWWKMDKTVIPPDEFDFKAEEGRLYKYTMISEESGEKIVTSGEVTEFIPGKKISFTWRNPGDKKENMPLVTLETEKSENGSEIVFTLTGFDGHKGDGFVYDGWDEILENLKKYLDNTNEFQR